MAIMAWSPGPEAGGEAASPLLTEIRQRLINVETKQNIMLAAAEPVARFSPDQWYGRHTYSQHGEDLVFLNVFRQIGIERPSWVDVGAHHPWLISNTALLYARGCRGVNVEANPHLIEAFRRERPEDVNLNIGASDREGVMTFHMIDRASGRNSFETVEVEAFVSAQRGFTVTERIEIPVTTLKRIVERECGGDFPDLLSIDAEGHDLAVLQGIDWDRPGPKLVCVEANTAAAEDLVLDYLEARNYRRIFAAGPNWLLLRADIRYP